MTDSDNRETGSRPAVVSRHERALLAAIITGSEDAIVSKTLDSIVTSWNPAAERLFGWTSAEMLGQSILRLIPVELHREEDEILAKLRAGQRIERYETTRVRKDGTRFPVSLTISPVRDADGNVVGASKIAHDITERRQAEEAVAALAAEAHALETLNRVGQSVAAEFDLDVIVQRITDAATELSGASFGAFFYNQIAADGVESYWLYSLSGAPRESFSGFPMPRSTEVFAPTFRGEGIVRSDDIRQDARFGRNDAFKGLPEAHLPVCSYLAVPVRTKNGEVIGGLFLGHPARGVFGDRAERLVAGIASQAAIAIENSRLIQRLKDREGALSKLLVERDDILQSERAARSEAERLGNLKDEFLATLSHELRTPLNAIQGWTQILMRGPKTSDQAKAFEVIDRNVRAQTRIIGDLLDMSQIISGKTLLEVRPIRLHRVIEDALDSIRHMATAKNILITPILDASIGPIQGDPNRLQQAIWNLLTNAIKFTPSSGRIQVMLERGNSHAEITIEDNGVGIRDEFLPYIFDRFRQQDASTTRRYGGLGLGLAIVKNLIELHGGTVRVNSRGENQGSTFILTLPIDQVHMPDERMFGRDAGVTAPLDAAELTRLAGRNVLIVDDEEDGRTLLARILRERGARCADASGGEEALAMLGQEHFDIILSDIGMPEMDGYDLIRQVRALDSRRTTPLLAVAITAYARLEDRKRSLQAGYHAHLAKPIEARELVATVAGLLRLTQ